MNYINAHATSTLVGDVAELNAVKKVFSGNVSNLKMNGTKSMTGHSLGAAGGLEALAEVLTRAADTRSHFLAQYMPLSNGYRNSLDNDERPSNGQYVV